MKVASFSGCEFIFGGVNSVGRVSASQAESRGFESRTPLQTYLMNQFVNAACCALTIPCWLPVSPTTSMQSDIQPASPVCVRLIIAAASGQMIFSDNLQQPASGARITNFFFEIWWLIAGMSIGKHKFPGDEQPGHLKTKKGYKNTLIR